MKRYLNKFLALTFIFYLSFILFACGGSDEAALTPASVNIVPVADAGIVQNVLTGTQVILNGSGSMDPDGDPLSYTWTLNSKPSGSAATLNDATSEQATFVADLDGTYNTSLIVNDGSVNSAPDLIAVTASTTNAAPIADAGIDQNLVTGTQGILNGSGSMDPDGDPLSYTWTLNSKPAGSSAALSDATSEQATFFADLDGTYNTSLVVNDGSVSSAPDLIIVIASTTNAAPIAVAGINMNVDTGSQVTFNGSGSIDPDGDPLTYAWTLDSKPAGSAATLNNATLEQAIFVADLDGTYNASLIVSDGSVNSPPDSIAVTAITTNSAIPPRAAAPLTIRQIHSGHSLTDSAMFQGTWPGHSINIWNQVSAGDYHSLIGKSTTPGSGLGWRWNNPVQWGQPDARLNIADWELLVITEGVPFNMWNGTEPGSAWYTGTLDLMRIWVEHTWNNGNNGNGATTLLYTTWGNIDAPDGIQWRADLGTNQPFWEQMADYGAENLPASAKVYIIPGNLLMMRLFDDIEAGVVPDIANINDFFTDTIHLNGLGSYALALLHIAVIHHVNPNSIGHTGYGLTPEPSVELANYLQAVVWEIASNYDRAGVP
jgi:hypothetical protein